MVEAILALASAMTDGPMARPTEEQRGVARAVAASDALWPPRLARPDGHAISRSA